MTETVSNNNTMIYKNENRPECIVVWEPTGEIDTVGLTEALEHTMCKAPESMVVVLPIKTDLDRCAIMIAPVGFTKEVAQIEYDNSKIFFNT